MSKEIIFNFENWGHGKCLACKCDLSINQVEQHRETPEHIENIKLMFEKNKNRALNYIKFLSGKIKTYDAALNEKPYKPCSQSDVGWGGVNVAFY